MAVATLPTEYICTVPVNLYKTPERQGLVTQAAAGRHLRLLPFPPEHSGKDVSKAHYVQLCEDDYPGWLAAEDLPTLQPADAAFHPIALTRAEIEPRLPEVIAFTRRAMAQPNTYLWGGTVGPNYDCSGLMQTAFVSVGIRLPRDSYQQEAFTQPIGWNELQPGDLIFFGPPERTKHVALYLGEGAYIHSSGKDQGRNGIGIDSLTDLSHPVSRSYHAQLRRPGRVMHSYISAQ
jgi:cell wall-associated NlpC family hydrolase